MHIHIVSQWATIQDNGIDWTAILTLVALFGTAFIYFLQWRTMQTNIKEQNLAWLIQYLQAPDVRKARDNVMQMSKYNKASPNWKDANKADASTACAAYGVAGIYIETHRVDSKVIIENWGPSIIKTYETCEEFIEELRDKNSPNYWKALNSIYELAKHK